MAPITSFLTLSAALVLACSQARAEGTQRALLIGIESYADFGELWYDLDGPFNDVALVRDVLGLRFDFPAEHITTLLDATRRQIEDAFADLIAHTEEGDQVYVHYSGHGSRVADANGDEGPGGFDSTLVPIDAREDPRGEILDDEIALWMHRLRQRTPHVVLFVDACHSGTISRAADPLKTRGAPTIDERSYAWSKQLDLEGLSRVDRERDGFVRLSACLDSQRAKEYRADDGQVFGLFTWMWCQALMEAGPSDTYGTVMRRVTAQVFQQRAHLQRPQLEGRDDALLFAGTVREVPNLLTVRALEDERVRLEGGLLQGVAVGSVFEAVRDVAPSRVEITQVSAVTSTARVLEGAPPAAGDLFREVARGQRLPPFRVLLDEPSRDLLADALSASASFELVEAPPADALLRLTEGEIRVLDERGEPYGAGLLDDRLLTLSSTAGPDPVVRALRRCYDLRDILQMTRAHLGFRPDVRIELVELVASECGANTVLEAAGECWSLASNLALRADDPTLTLPPETVLSFQIHNESLETLYFYLLNLSPDGRIEQFFPPRREDSRAEVWSGDTLSISSAFRLVEASAGLLDTYVWFITREPTDLGFLTQDAYTPTRGTTTRVERLALRFGGRRTRGEAPVPLQTGDLATRMVCIEVETPSSR